MEEKYKFDQITLFCYYIFVLYKNSQFQPKPICPTFCAQNFVPLNRWIFYQGYEKAKENFAKCTTEKAPGVLAKFADPKQVHIFHTYPWSYNKLDMKGKYISTCKCGYISTSQL